MEGPAQQLVLPALWQRKAPVQEGTKGQRQGHQWRGRAAQEEGIVWLLTKSLFAGICKLPWYKEKGSLLGCVDVMLALGK